MLYRLDYCDTHGKTTGPVRGADLGILPTGDVLCRHMSRARERAIQAANRAECDVLITRIGKSGDLKPSLIIDRDGRGKQPPGKRPSGGIEHREGGPCFCANCRAGRRGR